MFTGEGANEGSGVGRCVEGIGDTEGIGVGRCVEGIGDTEGSGVGAGDGCGVLATVSVVVGCVTTRSWGGLAFSTKFSDSTKSAARSRRMCLRQSF